MRGLLLINLGTPEAPEPGPVKRYLRQFLSDERVLDIGSAARAALLFVILRKRPAESAAAYKKIWTERGSPLLFHTVDLAEAVGRALGDDWKVAVGMRYGEPSIGSALAGLRAGGADDVVVIPLYPQYASSSTGTALEELYRVAGGEWNVANLRVASPFYRDDRFIEAFAHNVRSVIAEFEPDHILFSYHGLPERHVQKSGAEGFCLAESTCCDAISEKNQNCYRAQCFATTRALASELELETAGYSVSFQSRLGRDPWIKPFTDVVLDELAGKGVKRLAVVCPSFVADCLETLEEIAIRADEQFRAAGGEALALVPSLNNTPRWVDTVCALAKAE